MDWLSNATGKYFSNNTLSRKARAMGQPQVRFRQFCKREGQYGKRSGQVLLFDKIGKIKHAAEFGKKFQLITSQYLSQRGEEKRK